jgi:hypothetical protein
VTGLRGVVYPARHGKACAIGARAGERNCTAPLKPVACRGQRSGVSGEGSGVRGQGSGFKL